MDRAARNRKLGENRSKLERGLMRYLIWLTLASCAATNLPLKWSLAVLGDKDLRRLHRAYIGCKQGWRI